MKYKVLGDRRATIPLGEGWPVSDPGADRYKGLVGKLVMDIGGTVLLEFECGGRQAFRPTSLIAVDDSQAVSNAPPDRYKHYKVIDMPCTQCGEIVKVEAAEGAKTTRCGDCVRGGNPHLRTQPVSDDELLAMYFDECLSFAEIAETLGKRFDKRPSTSTVARWMEWIVEGTDLNLRTQSEAAIIAKRRHPPRVKRPQMMVSTKGK